MDEFADEDAESWASIAFNTVQFLELPVRVTGDSIKNKLDIKDVKGADGTTITPRGSSARKFKVQLIMFRADHRRAFEALLPLVGARYTKTKGQPVTITYPSLALAGISQAWVETASIPDGDERGLFKVEIECIEYLVPKPAAKKTAKSTKSNGSRIVDETRGLGGEATGRKIDLDHVPASMFRDDLIPPFVPNFEP